jgi:SAM-dependent methyltransferase
MVGLDISSNLLKIAKSRWRNAQLVKADMRFLPFKPLAFSAAVSIGMSFGYLPSEQDNLRSLSELHQTLGERGFLIVDVFNREHLILKYKSKQMQLRWKFIPGLLKFPKRLSMWLLFRFFKWKQYPNFLLLQKRTINTAGDWLCDLWVVYDKVNGQTRVFRHLARLYTPNQLQALLTKAGFTVRAVYGDYEGHPLRVDSSPLVLVATS